jgi:hypothetical protein
VADRIGKAMQRLAAARAGTEVIDEATGIIVSIEPDDPEHKRFFVQARFPAGRLIWQSIYDWDAGVKPTLRLMNGEVVLLPIGDVREVARGRLIRRIKPGGAHTEGQESNP